MAAAGLVVAPALALEEGSLGVGEVRRGLGGSRGLVWRRKEGRGGSNLSGGPRRQWRQRRREKAREEEWVGPGVHGREREQLETREGSRVALYGRGREVS